LRKVAEEREANLHHQEDWRHINVFCLFIEMSPVEVRLSAVVQLSERYEEPMARDEGT